jgi:ankyrin repeat protein
LIWFVRFPFDEEKLSLSKQQVQLLAAVASDRADKAHKVGAKLPTLHVVDPATRESSLTLALQKRVGEATVQLLLSDATVRECVARHRNAQHDTALHIAARFASVHVFKRIEACGVSVADLLSLRGAHGRTPLHAAAASGNHATLRRLLKLSAASHNGDAAARSLVVDACDADGCTPLLHAVRARSTPCLKELVFAGALFHSEADCGRAALHEAAARDFANGIYLLHACGADVAAPLAASGSTPLHLCAMVDAARACLALYACGALDHDAATRRRNLAGQSALELAEKCGAAKVIAILRSPPPLAPPRPVDVRPPAGEKVAADDDDDNNNNNDDRAADGTAAALFRRVPVDLARLPPIVQRLPDTKKEKSRRISSKASGEISRSQRKPKEKEPKEKEPAAAAAAAVEEQQVCSECNVAIAPGKPFMRALGRVFHPEHLVCACCGKQFANGMFMTNGKTVFCSAECHQTLKAAKRSAAVRAVVAKVPRGSSSSATPAPVPAPGPSHRNSSRSHRRSKSSHKPRESRESREPRAKPSQRAERPKAREEPPPVPASLRASQSAPAVPGTIQPPPPPYAPDFAMETKFWEEKRRLSDADLPAEVAALRAQAKARTTTTTTAKSPAPAPAVDALRPLTAKAKSPRTFDEYDVAPPEVQEAVVVKKDTQIPVATAVAAMKMPPQLAQFAPRREASSSSSSSSSSGSSSSGSSSSGMEIISSNDGSDSDDGELVLTECPTMVFGGSGTGSTTIFVEAGAQEVVQALTREDSFVSAGGHVGTFALTKKPPPLV